MTAAAIAMRLIRRPNQANAGSTPRCDATIPRATTGRLTATYAAAKKPGSTAVSCRARAAAVTVLIDPMKQRPKPAPVMAAPPKKRAACVLP
jgi:hypothetical protein